MKPRVRLLAALPPLTFALLLGGCFFFIGGDRFPGMAMQAYAPDKTTEDAVRTVDAAMVAAGLTAATGWQTGSPGVGREPRMTTDFMMPDKTTAVSATIESRPRGALVCIRFMGRMGDDDFEPHTKATIARLRAALLERFGADYVTATPCSQEPYWPGAIASRRLDL